METAMQALEQTLLAYLRDLYPEWADGREAAKTLNTSAVKIRAACESLMRQGKAKGRSLAKGYFMQARETETEAAQAAPESWENNPLFKAHFEKQKSGLYRIIKEMEIKRQPENGGQASSELIAEGVLVRRKVAIDLLAALEQQAPAQAEKAEKVRAAAPVPENKPSAARKPCKPFTPNPTRGYEVQRGKVKIFLDRKAASRVLTLNIEDLRELIRAVEKAE